LAQAFRAAGHRVDMFGKRNRAVDDAIACGADVLAVAGGDGTVSKAVITASRAQSSAPLLILPVGTSNNIARSLGICRPVDAIARTLQDATPRRLDVGRIAREGDARAFVEAAGVGFIGAMLEQRPGKAEKLMRAIRDLVTSKASLDRRKARGVARLIRGQPSRPSRNTLPRKPRPRACRVGSPRARGRSSCRGRSTMGTWTTHPGAAPAAAIRRASSWVAR
jgi:hypothetical protein